MYRSLIPNDPPSHPSFPPPSMLCLLVHGHFPVSSFSHHFILFPFPFIFITHFTHGSSSFSSVASSPVPHTVSRNQHYISIFFSPIVPNCYDYFLSIFSLSPRFTVLFLRLFLPSTYYSLPFLSRLPSIPSSVLSSLSHVSLFSKLTLSNLLLYTTPLTLLFGLSSLPSLPPFSLPVFIYLSLKNLFLTYSFPPCPLHICPLLIFLASLFSYSFILSHTPHAAVLSLFLPSLFSYAPRLTYLFLFSPFVPSRLTPLHQCPTTIFLLFFLN